MDNFTPEKNYHPEDEYESLDIAGEQIEAEAGAPANAPAPEPADASADVIPTIPKYQYAAAPKQAEPAPQPIPAQPIPQPIQQPAGYPNAVPPTPYYPVYQQPIQQPVTQTQQPVTQQPVTQQPANYYYPPTAQQPPQPVPAQPNPRTSVQNIQPYAQRPQQPTGTVYPQPAARQTKPPKEPTSTGTKVFIIILCALLAAMIVGFAVYIATSQRSKGAPESNPGNLFSIDGDEEDGSNDYEVDPFGGYNFNSNSVTYSDVEDTISLKAENGETQKRDDDNPESVGEPNEKAKSISLEALPKDKNDEKYSTQSAYNAVSDSVVTVVCYEKEITDNTADMLSQGSGVIISSDGYLITNAHVISNSRRYLVNIVMNNGDEHQAKIVGYDTWTDLAVLKIDAEDLKAVTFGDSELVEIGDDVIAIGSPGGKQFKNTLTKGIVSALDRELSVNKNVRYIQSDAAISPGSSGGPLCNIYGQVIGITTAKTVAENFENMSFSIPSATVEQVVDDLMHYGYVKGRTRMGFSGKEIASSDAASYDVPAGVLVSEIDESGSLAGSDIKEGDIITELDGKTITSFQDIYDVLADHKPDDEITVKAKRPSTSSK